MSLLSRQGWARRTVYRAIEHIVPAHVRTASAGAISCATRRCWTGPTELDQRVQAGAAAAYCRIFTCCRQS